MHELLRKPNDEELVAIQTQVSSKDCVAICTWSQMNDMHSTLFN